MQSKEMQWAPAPRPVDEALRLAALQGLWLLDTPPEPIFDDMVLLAKHCFDVSMVTITLIDEHRQYFKASVGTDDTATCRDDSFCSHAILREDPTVVLNALEDETFGSNPFVVGKPFIRFYAGAPLLSSNGFRIGTFCIMDRSPRSEFPASELSALCRFAAQTSRIIETRRQSRAMDHISQDNIRLESRLRTVLESTANPIVLLNPTWDLLYVNQCAREALGGELRETTCRSPRYSAGNLYRRLASIARSACQPGPSLLSGS